ncbi:MAG TPA: alpha-amylase, partial [Burkholderiales bacterium]
LRTAQAAAGASVAAAEAHGGFLAMIGTLGQRTAELHVALSQRTGDPAFDPEPLLAADIAAFRKRAAAEAEMTLALLGERLAQLPAHVQEPAQALLAARENLQWRIATAAIDEKDGIKTRYHGDYHLGQVLVSGSDFVIIDFEGEPARSFEERREKSSPLRDVAGMLRSFNYARWSALRNVTHHAGELERLGTATQAWEHAARTTFLSGYGEALAAGAPGARISADLLALFELEKAMYELRYELNNRVDWVQVPLQGILALLEGNPARRGNK